MEKSKWFNSTEPFFVLSKRHTPPRDALRYPDLVDVVHRVCDRPSVCPRNWVSAVGWQGWNQAECTGGWPWPDRYEYTRATSISPRTNVTPYPIFHSPAMARLDRKGLHPKKYVVEFYLVTGFVKKCIDSPTLTTPVLEFLFWFLVRRARFFES